MGQKRATVAIERCASYDLEAVLSAVKNVVDRLGGVGQFKEKYGRRVLLKPNLLTGAAPEQAVTTHPVVVEAVARLFVENGFDVFVGDSPAVDSTSAAARKCGVTAAAERAGARMVDFSKTVEVQNPQGKLVQKFTVAKITQEVDFIVTLPKLKTHGQMYYTGAIKNMFGAVSGLQKSQFHLRFPERERFATMIVDLALMLRPRLAIMDAVVAMEGVGPMSGTPKPLGFFAGSLDLLALDCLCAGLIGYSVSDIPILRDALTRGEWIASTSDIDVTGCPVADVRPEQFSRVSITKDITFIPRWVPPLLARIIADLMVKKPRFNGNKCVLCARCLQICPANALRIEARSGGTKRHVAIDDERCIRCYCCHEICAPEAIDLRRSVRRLRWRDEGTEGT
jgi:uncharacterized protein (DUF362 family)/Pyruvate/2-oxoacid:ferredoxin oxidoreductase delta subunit